MTLSIMISGYFSPEFAATVGCARIPRIGQRDSMTKKIQKADFLTEAQFNSYPCDPCNPWCAI